MWIQEGDVLIRRESWLPPPNPLIKSKLVPHLNYVCITVDDFMAGSMYETWKYASCTFSSRKVNAV